jgi:hypothetical protein
MNPAVFTLSSHATVKICWGEMHRLHENCLPVRDGRLMGPSYELRWTAQFARGQGKQGQPCGSG